MLPVSAGMEKASFSAVILVRESRRFPYACARAGWTYTSDDTSYLMNDSAVPRVIGHSHRMRFRPSARTLFRELEGRKLTPRLEGKPSLEIPTSEFPGLITAGEARVHSIVYLNRSSSGTGKLILLPHGTATERMCNELYSAGETVRSTRRYCKSSLKLPRMNCSIAILSPRFISSIVLRETYKSLTKRRQRVIGDPSC